MTEKEEIMSENEQPAKQMSEEVQRPLLEQIDESQTLVPPLSNEELEEIAGGSTLSFVGWYAREHPVSFATNVTAIAAVSAVTVSVTVYETNNNGNRNGGQVGKN